MSTTDLSSNCKPIKTYWLLSCVAWLLFASAASWAVIGMDQKVFEQMQRVQEAAEAEDYAAAHALLNHLMARSLNDHELAQVKNLEGNIFTMEKKYPQAVASFEAVVAASNIPDGLRQSALLVLVQLQMVAENYPQAIAYSEQLLQIKQQPDSNLLALRAQCFYHQEDYPRAEAAIKSAIDVEQAAGGRARENWLLLLNAIYHFRSDYQAMVPVLDQLIRDYPKDKYVYNLAAVYGQLEQLQKQLLLLEPLYESGYLNNKSQVLLLAQLFIAEGVPAKAARVLERELNWRDVGAGEFGVGGEAPAAGWLAEQRDLELLAQAWTLAKEPKRAIAPLTRAAAMAEDGNSSLRLAHTYISVVDWAGAAVAIEQALAKGGLHDKGNALVLLGMAQYRQKQFTAAIETFARAQGFKSVAKMSEQWLTYVRGQQQKTELAEVAR
ncbi:tetratricopeptide repeat protein [Halioxenophilus sp. WMMB6]|uniref:tetratricopeptide repeat protein n=1 Tax=Halioxenophilus sp. WMMB6 TaxID=3073815 RepID=UPI00295F52B6|nr:tetratricopeptide repeat protein [Halioxenophilus sp. WMMB6]